MSDPLGLSIGTTNLVAARVGDPPVTRRSVLTMSGQVLTGFVERVGDPVPMVTADGSSHPADELMVDALDALIGEMGGPPSPQLAVAVPAHWTGATLRALRVAMRSKPSLAPNGVPARLVSDAVAALTALHANPGLPASGVVVLVDLGGGGTSITLADAASTFEPIETSRFTEFSGDQIDQALLAHVLDDIADADGVDPAGTAAVGSLTMLRDGVSAGQGIAVHADGRRRGRRACRSTVRRCRSPARSSRHLMDAPFAGVLAEMDDLLQRNRIPWSDVSTVVAVGGGASIPMITRRLSGARTGAAGDDAAARPRRGGRRGALRRLRSGGRRRNGGGARRVDPARCGDGCGAHRFDHTGRGDGDCACRRGPIHYRKRRAGFFDVPPAGLVAG